MLATRGTHGVCATGHLGFLMPWTGLVLRSRLGASGQLGYARTLRPSVETQPNHAWIVVAHSIVKFGVDAHDVVPKPTLRYSTREQNVVQR